MFALDEIQRGDTRRERIDGGIASRRFEKSRAAGERKLKYGRGRGNGPLRPDTHPWHVKLSVLDRRISDRWMDRTIVEPIRFPFPSQPRAIHARIHMSWCNVRGNSRIIERRRSTWPGLCRSDERKVISNQIWGRSPPDHEFVLASQRMPIRVFCFFAGINHFSTIQNDEKWFFFFFKRRNYIRGRV